MQTDSRDMTADFKVERALVIIPTYNEIENVPTLLDRVLVTDPGMGIVRHVDAGYTEAADFAKKNQLIVPGRTS